MERLHKPSVARSLHVINWVQSVPRRLPHPPPQPPAKSRFNLPGGLHATDSIRRIGAGKVAASGSEQGTSNA